MAPVTSENIDFSLVPYWHSPADWITDCIIWKKDRHPTEYQLETAQSLVRDKRVAVRGPHGLGKTSMASWLVLWFAVTRDMAGVDWKAPTTASNWRQLAKYLWPEIHKWARLLNWDRIGREPFRRDELLTLNLKLRTGEAFALASDDPGALEGAHADHLFYMFDESKEIPDGTFDAAEGAFSTAGEQGTEAYALAISTPGDPEGRFYAIHSRYPGTEDWSVRHVTLAEAIAAGRVTEEWAEQRHRLWGDSSVYMNRVLGEFAASSEDSVIPLAWIEKANERWRLRYGDERKAPGHPDGVKGRPREPHSGTWAVVKRDEKLHTIGVDVARGGEDRSVMALRQGNTICELRRAPFSDDTMQLAGMVLGCQRGHGLPKAIIDSIGIGAGVYDRLREEGVPCSGFVASAGIKRTDITGEFGFTNCRSWAWWNLREMLDPVSECDVALPPDDRLTGDLTAPKWKVMSGGRIQVESKDDIRKRIERSTDDGDAVVEAMSDTGSSWADIYREPEAQPEGIQAPTNRKARARGWGDLYLSDEALAKRQAEEDAQRQANGDGYSDDYDPEPEPVGPRKGGYFG